MMRGQWRPSHQYQCAHTMEIQPSVVAAASTSYLWVTLTTPAWRETHVIAQSQLSRWVPPSLPLSSLPLSLSPHPYNGDTAVSSSSINFVPLGYPYYTRVAGNPCHCTVSVQQVGAPCCGRLWVRHMICGQTCDGLYHFVFYLINPFRGVPSR